MPTIDLNVYESQTSPSDPVLGDIVVASPTPVAKFSLNSVKPILPYFIIGFGSLLLIIPLLLSKILK
jgi:hypothetical protein